MEHQLERGDPRIQPSILAATRNNKGNKGNNRKRGENYSQMESKRGKARQLFGKRPIHHKNELGLHQSRLVLVLVFLLLVSCAPLFLLLLHNPTTQPNSTPNNGVTKQPLFVHRGRFGRKNTSRILTLDIWKTKTFFWTYLPLFTLTFPLNSTYTNPFFSNKGSLRSHPPPLFFFKPSIEGICFPFVHSFDSLVCSTGRLETGNGKQETTTIAITPQDTHTGYS